MGRCLPKHETRMFSSHLVLCLQESSSSKWVSPPVLWVSLLRKTEQAYRPFRRTA